MKIWKIVFLVSCIVSIGRCDNDSESIIENEIEPEYKEDNLVRQKKSHPSTTCIPGITDETCNSDDEYTVSSSSNYYSPPVQPGYGPAPPPPPPPPQQQPSPRPSYPTPQYSQYSPQPPSAYGPQPSSYGAGPSHYAPTPYKPPTHAYYAPPQPQKLPYGAPSSPPQAVPPRSLYGPPSQPLYRTFDMMDHQNMQRPFMMEEVGSFLHRPTQSQCIPFHPPQAPLPVAPPSPCAQQFTVSCTPQIYASAKPQPPPVYYQPAPRPPVYAPPPIVYAPEPTAMYAIQPHPSQMQQSNNKLPQNAYRTNDNGMISNPMMNGQQAPNDQQNMMMVDKNTSTTPSVRNEAPNQQQSPSKPANMMPSNDGGPPKVNNMLKFADQIKENDKKAGPNGMSVPTSWDNKM